MVDLVSQLTLNLFKAENFDFKDFIEGQNGETVATLENWLGEFDPSSFYLWGGRGTGKTHLLQSAVRKTNGTGSRAIYLPLKSVGSNLQSVIEDLEEMDFVALDDVETFYGIEAEKSLFNLYNWVKEAGGKILFSSSIKPGSVESALPDLASRFNSGLVYKLHELDESEKVKFLIRVAEYRGLKLERSVVDFIMRTYKRDLVSLSIILNLLDSASLQYSRALTIPFVREILNSGNDGR